MPRFDLLAVDLDGTLFDSSRSVSEETHNALRRAERAGTKIAVVTGRRLPAAMPFIEHLDIDPVLAFNSGALVKEGFKGPILERQFLSRAIAKQVLALGREAGVEPVLHDGPNGEGHIFIETEPTSNRSLASYLEKTNPPPHYVPDLMRAVDRDPVQVGFAAGIRSIRALAETIESRIDGPLYLGISEYPDRDLALLDVLSPLATKGKVLLNLASRYRVPKERTMAVGDNWNDLDMLEAAGTGVLMSNAPPDLRARGFILTASNDEAGVARAIEKYILG
jgi:hydroxymethylpyrimidine pyrophosphatase-like HAD family hydrolase